MGHVTFDDWVSTCPQEANESNLAKGEINPEERFNNKVHVMDFPNVISAMMIG